MYASAAYSRNLGNERTLGEFHLSHRLDCPYATVLAVDTNGGMVYSKPAESR